MDQYVHLGWNAAVVYEDGLVPGRFYNFEVLLNTGWKLRKEISKIAKAEMWVLPLSQERWSLIENRVGAGLAVANYSRDAPSRSGWSKLAAPPPLS